jgi:di/tricarboxylate transporter
MADIILVSAIVLGALILFVSEKLRADLVALLIMATLMTIGVFRPDFLSPQEGISGFSNKATVTIAAMFILSAGLVKTGAIQVMSHRILHLAGNSETRLFLVLMVTVGAVSAFINNTAAVAVFLPITLTVCRQHRISPSRLLIPLSYVSIVGGTCTLIGTSTNILVSSMSANHGVGEFGMFELTKLGVVFFGVGLLYLALVRKRLLPDRSDTNDLTRKYKMNSYFTRLVVDKKSPLVLRTVAEADLGRRYDVTVLEIVRGEQHLWTELRDTKIHEDDELLVRGAARSIMELTEAEGVVFRSHAEFGAGDLSDDETVLAEAIVAPSASLVGQTLKTVRFRQMYGVIALAIQKHGRPILDKIGNIRLDAGDALLVQGTRAAVEALWADRNFLVLTELEVPRTRRHKAPIALAIIGMVVALAALDVMPIVVSAIAGSVLLVATGCVKLREAYESIDWLVIFMLAGVIPLGIAMERTGTAFLVASGVYRLAQELGPVAVVSVFYLVTTIFASVMSHNAAAILLVPIGIAAANEMGVSPMPILMAITFAASSALSTPFGYHTNLMVYSPGGYRFSDYLKVGLPLNLIFWVLSSVLIPILWPLYPAP